MAAVLICQTGVHYTEKCWKKVKRKKYTIKEGKDPNKSHRLQGPRPREIRFAQNEPRAGIRSWVRGGGKRGKGGGSALMAN